MEALKRKPDLSPRKTITLADGTVIKEIGMTVRKNLELINDKSLSQEEIGLKVLSAKILVNGKPISVDDLQDCFTTEEFEEISEMINSKKDEKGDPEKNG